MHLLICFWSKFTSADQIEKVFFSSSSSPSLLLLLLTIISSIGSICNFENPWLSLDYNIDDGDYDDDEEDDDDNDDDGIQVHYNAFLESINTFFLMLEKFRALGFRLYHKEVNLYEPQNVFELAWVHVRYLQQ